MLNVIKRNHVHVRCCNHSNRIQTGIVNASKCVWMRNAYNVHVHTIYTVCSVHSWIGKFSIIIRLISHVSGIYIQRERISKNISSSRSRNFGDISRFRAIFCCCCCYFYPSEKKHAKTFGFVTLTVKERRRRRKNK